MAVLLYNIFIQLYLAGISLAAIFNKKARLWISGRNNIFERLKQSIADTPQVIWVHCASLGEFEQGRPVIESLRKEYPNYKILLTFFSPSGYEIRKDYNGAEWVFYLPHDSPRNAKHFLEIVKPSLAIFVKYEYWYHYLHQLHQQQIPAVLISAIFQKDKIFFKWYGTLHRNMLQYFRHIFVQDVESKTLLQTILPKEKVSVAGDTRFDRVMEIATQFKPIVTVERFAIGRTIMVAGSTWPEDEKHLKLILNKIDELSLIIAPHEITPGHINFIQSIFPNNILYSELEKDYSVNGLNTRNVLIINNIGMLSKLYRYATICYVGGGFNKSGIHNTLEAAVYGKPVIFGPNYEKFSEAVELIKNKGGYSYKTENEFTEIITNLLCNEPLLKASAKSAGNFVKTNTGATSIILHFFKKIFF